MVKYLFVIIFFTQTYLCYGLDVPQSANPMNYLNQFKDNPNDYIPNYTSNPKETAINQDNITNQVINNAYSNKQAIDIRSSYQMRAKYDFSKDNLSLSDKVIDNAKDIIDGISNKYVDCSSDKKCVIEYNKNITYCESPVKMEDIKCHRERSVKVFMPPRITKSVRIEISGYSKSGATYSYNIREQKLVSSTYGTPSISQDSTIEGINCDNFSMALIEDGYAPNTATRRVSKTVTLTGTCQNPVLTVSLSQGHHGKDKYEWLTRGAYGIVRFDYQPEPILSDSFNTSCLEIKKREELGICKPVQEQCLKQGAAKIIDGVEVKRDCWLYETKYSCTQNNITDTCSKYDTSNCIQVSAKCSKYIDNICVATSRGFSCALNKCSDQVTVTCGNDVLLNEVIDTNVHKTKEEDPKFAESVTKLASIRDAITNVPGNFNENTPFIFKGRVMECREYGFLGIKNCCKDNGWGIDLELTKCSSSEKELAKLKDEGLTVLVGNNEHDRGPLEPARVDKRYCVFDSKIAQLIQIHGKNAQLGIGFGTGKNPDCRGLTPSELAKIKLDKIDFTSAFSDVTSRQSPYDKDIVQDKALQKIKEYYKKERHGDA